MTRPKVGWEPLQLRARAIHVKFYTTAFLFAWWGKWGIALVRWDKDIKE